MLVFLDVQHIGKPSRRRTDDWGAAYDIDGDGIIAQHEIEAANTWIYAGHAMQRLRELGHSVMALADGWYQHRHDRVNDYCDRMLQPGGHAAYIALHLNAGGGNYGAIFHDYRSAGGPLLGAEIAGALRRLCPELSAVKTIPSSPNDWTKNAYGTIKNVQRPIGICYEPFFMDSPGHLGLFSEDGLERVGIALAEGINNFYSKTKD